MGNGWRELASVVLPRVQPRRGVPTGLRRCAVASLPATKTGKHRGAPPSGGGAGPLRIVVNEDTGAFVKIW
jgi:hypothetical protein